MQLRVFPAFVVFVGSYLPLTLILLVQNYEFDAVSRPLCLAFWTPGCSLPFKNPEIALIGFGIALICLCATLALLTAVTPRRLIAIKTATYVPADLMNYTLPYIVSFMSIEYQDTGKFVGLIIFLLWMFVITFRSGQIILNPVLIVFGWRPYDIEYKFPGSDALHTGRALVRGDIAANEQHRQFQFQDTFIIKVSKQTA